MLDVDENMKFKSDLYPNLIRTGTLGEGSCFIHAILKGINKTYSKMDKKNKLKYVENLRKDISESINLSFYKNNLFNISQLHLSTSLSKYLKVLYNFIEEPASFISIPFLINIVESNIVVFKMITTVMTEKEFVNIIESPFVTSSPNIDQYIQNYNNSFFKFFIQKLNEEEVKLSQEQLEICKTKIEKFIYSTCEYLVEKNFEKYKRDLKSTSVWCSDSIFSLVSDYLNVDIYFIDVNKRKVYIDNLPKKNRPSVVIGWIDQSHFENIGILENKDDKIIKRVFAHDHPFIIKLKSELKL
jgi:hypothetical protein